MSQTSIKVKIKLNGEVRNLECLPRESLADTLRDRLGTMSVKRGCDFGGCGVCTILLDGKPVYSCMTPTWSLDGSAIETLEGLKGKDRKDLDLIQQAFDSNFAQQCGYCTPAMILCSKALLATNPKPSADQVKDALSGVLCRCTGYLPIIDAVLQASNSRPTKEQRP